MKTIRTIRTIFVYSKSGVVKVLDLEDERKQRDELTHDGWKHTATLDARRHIEYLANSSDEEILSTIKGLRA